MSAHEVATFSFLIEKHLTSLTSVFQTAHEHQKPCRLGFSSIGSEPAVLISRSIDRDGLPMPASSNKPLLVFRACFHRTISFGRDGRVKFLYSQSVASAERRVTILLCRIVCIGSQTTPKFSVDPSMACITSRSVFLGNEPPFGVGKKIHDNV